MFFRLAIEDIEPDHWVAYVLDLPGCISSGETEEEAVVLAPDRISQYLVWLAEHQVRVPVADESINLDVVESFGLSRANSNPVTW